MASSGHTNPDYQTNDIHPYESINNRRARGSRGGERGGRESVACIHFNHHKARTGRQKPVQEAVRAMREAYQVAEGSHENNAQPGTHKLTRRGIRARVRFYGTVSSERATKGQGGNKLLNVVIQAGDSREEIVTIKLIPHGTIPNWHTLTLDLRGQRRLEEDIES